MSCKDAETDASTSIADASTKITDASAKITDRLRAVATSGRSSFSLEFFPPSSEQGMANLAKRLERMRALNPLFVNVTYGAGGSSTARSLELAKLCVRLGFTTCLHLTCTNMDDALLDGMLAEARKVGIRNILALRGDRPREAEYNIPSSSRPCFCHAVDLIRYIRAQYGDWFCIGVAGYPEGHFDEDTFRQDVHQDLPFLVQKVSAGADFVLTQIIYDPQTFVNYERLVRNIPQLKSIPIILHIMPIQSYASFIRMINLTKVTVPSSLLRNLEEHQEDNDQIKAIGVTAAVDCIRLLKQGALQNNLGIHFSTLNLERNVTRVLEKTAPFMIWH